MPDTAASILVVDDDVALGRVLVMLLAQDGFAAQHASSGARALELLDAQPFDVVVTDLRMPGMDGLELLATITRRWPGMPVLLLTAHGTVKAAVEAMRRGAAGFLLKPWDRAQLLFEIRKALARADTKAVPDVALDTDFVGESPVMREVHELIDRAAKSSANVLVRGESGTGKERVVQAIHKRSARRDGPLIAVHCGALPDSLIEDELFGHEKGAFTGAAGRRQGRVELADGGTLFLDEIGDISLTVQVKLLRVLQERTYERLGGSQTLQADVRFIAATHRDLEAGCRAGTFREDLFYRLNVVPIWLPPLRERGEDILRLARHFAELFIREHDSDVTLTPGALARLSEQSWPGNVRELRNFVERLVVLAGGPTITDSDVLRELSRAPLTQSEAVEDAPADAAVGQGGAADDAGASDANEDFAAGASSLEDARREAERAFLVQTLKRCEGHRTKAARICGVSRRTFYNLLERHGLSTPDK